MCTVSYIPQAKSSFILTSSRDEQSPRNAQKLSVSLTDNFRMVFPVDPVSGGTWIGSSELGRTCCLLNGGKKKHNKKPAYRKSRGLVLVDLLSAYHLEEEIRSYNLDGIEPFTMIIIDHHDENKFAELVWDENEKHISYYNRNKPKIWSSATLYSDDQRKFKSALFKNFLTQITNPDKIAGFHFLPENILSANNSGYPMTVSITQILGNDFETNVKHLDFINHTGQEDYLTILRPFYA